MPTNILGLELSKRRVKNPSSNIPPEDTRVDPLLESIHSPCFKISLAEQYTREEQSKNIYKKKMEDSKRFLDDLMIDFSLFLAMNHDLCGNQMVSNLACSFLI